jgi:isocitrate dehydrogenase
MTKKITIFVIQAYVEKDGVGNVTDICTLELIDETAEKALERARQIITKPNYRISQIIEKEING